MSPKDETPLTATIKILFSRKNLRLRRRRIRRDKMQDSSSASHNCHVVSGVPQHNAALRPAIPPVWVRAAKLFLECFGIFSKDREGRAIVFQRGGEELLGHIGPVLFRQDLGDQVVAIGAEVPRRQALPYAASASRVLPI